MLGKWIKESTLQVGDRVGHVRVSELSGVVVSVDNPAYSCMVMWDGSGLSEFMWADKLYLLEDNSRGNQA